MWSKAELRDRAKDCLRRYYWATLAITFLIGILGGGNDGGEYSSSGASARQQISQTRYQTQYYDDGMGGGMSSSDWALFADMMTVVIVVFLVIMAVVMLFHILVGNVMTVSGNRYSMESRAVGCSAGVSKIFYGFGSGNYLNTVKTQFLKDLSISLWSLLPIVPGVIKTYQYYMTPYILSENPGMGYRDALDLSCQMMDGHKQGAFVLGLSFVGWCLLGPICCCIGVIFVEPYMQATMAESYAVLKGNIGYTGLRGSDDEDEHYDNMVGEQ